MILNTICTRPARDSWPDLQPELDTLARYPEVLQGQDPIRAWEYARALRAINAWEQIRVPLEEGLEPYQILDLGGAGSQWWQVLTGLTSEDIVVVDPSLPPPTVDLPIGQVVWNDESVELYAASRRAGRFDICTCVSVIEHIPTRMLPEFFRAAARLLKPGGLFVLTTDYWATEGPDTAHFHWMRDHIYTPDTLRGLQRQLRAAGFQAFGDTDFTWHGNMVCDYSMLTLACLRKG